MTFDASPSNARSESAIAANPLDSSNMVGASKRFTDPAAYDFTLAACVTFDAGRSWVEASPLELPAGWGGMSDPTLAWDNVGNAYLVVLPFGPGAGPDSPVIGIAVYKSSDGGRNWGVPQLIHQSRGDDKQWATGDRTPGSPFYGNVYAVWDSSGLSFARTTDHGATWKGVGDLPAGTPLPGANSFAPVVAVSDDGAVYIAWIDVVTIRLVKSIDGGQSFSAPLVVASGITPLRSSGSGFPKLPGGSFRVLTLPDICTGSGGNITVAWADFREGVSRIYCRHSNDGALSWQGSVSGQALLPAALASGADQQEFHPQLASMPSGQVACAFYEFGPKGGPTSLIDVVLAMSTDGGANFSQRDTVTDGPWDPKVDAPLSHGDPSTTFIGDYFGLTGSALGFFPLWTDTRTGIQELFSSRPLRVGPWTGVQFHDTLATSQTVTWLTFGWPACWHVLWTVMPVNVAAGAPQIKWRVQVSRSSQAELCYWITVTNDTAQPVDVEGRFSILLAD